MGLSMDGDREMVSRLLLAVTIELKTPSWVRAHGGVITSRLERAQGIRPEFTELIISSNRGTFLNEMRKFESCRPSQPVRL
jgi:hypothetical protein